MGEYVYDETPIPLGPRARRMAEQRNRTRVRQQRRLSANTMPEEDDLEIGGPGPVTDSGLSEQDVEAPDRTAAVREQVQALAGNVTQAAGQGLAQPQAPQMPQAAPVAPPVAPQAPAQPAEEDEDMEVGAQAMQLRPPMSGPAPQASTPLRAPGVMASLEDDDDSMEAPGEEMAEHATGAEPDDEEIGAPSQKGMPAADDGMASVHAESQAIREQHRRARIAATIVAALGASPEQTAGMTAPYDPQAPYERYAAEQAAQQEQADADWRRQLEERRAGIEDRRIAQAESATDARNRRTGAEYDVDSADAQGMRDLYDATINSLPEEAQRMLGGMVGVDTTTWNANTMQEALDQLNETVSTLRTTNPRAFRQGQRSTGRQRRGGRLGGPTGGGGTRDYGYGVQSRAGGARLAEGPDGVAPMETGLERAPARGGGRTGGGRAAAPAARPGTPPDLRVRAPTTEEIAANPELAYQETLIQGAAHRMGVDIDTPEGRAAAAVYVDRGMGEGAEDRIMLEGAASRDRTPEQQRQVEQYVQRYGDVIGREDQLRQLGGTLRRTLSEPNGAQIVRAALHANEGLPSSLANLSSEVTRVRAQIYSFLNEYFSTYGGANVTENELMRYYSAFGAGSVNADPAEFLSAVQRSRRREQGRIEQGARAYPEGARLFYEENN